MAFADTQEREKLRRDKAKRAIALAMQNRWSEAVAANTSILNDFPDDIEAYNRLGKALTELGRHRDARTAFERALEVSPHNTIAKKNLDRLARLGDDAPQASVMSTEPHAFIEESGKAGVTSLINLASPEVLLKMSPGYPVVPQVEGRTLKIADTSGEYLGQIEPRLASRLVRLIKGGNRYDATVTSVGEQELTIIVREVYQHQSQAETVSFPSKGGSDYRVYLPGTILGYELGEEETDESDPATVKDWSDDDTEPGDDDAFKPVVHRIINTGEESRRQEEDF
jgi:hypothetical protein